MLPGQSASAHLFLASPSIIHSFIPTLFSCTLLPLPPNHRPANEPRAPHPYLPRLARRYPPPSNSTSNSDLHPPSTCKYIRPGSAGVNVPALPCVRAVPFHPAILPNSSSYFPILDIF
ncbi:hypothetical protein K439DRAFT_889735 [Ramaria rubella]|nr:hypothetical protein K439DRAFT_889735 [Ramaria rubella]